MASPAQPVTCSRCGAVATEPGMDWMFEIDPRRGPVTICGACARENLRSIEAKLDQHWW
jgi:hypothetical protein